MKTLLLIFSLIFFTLPSLAEKKWGAATKAASEATSAFESRLMTPAHIKKFPHPGPAPHVSVDRWGHVGSFEEHRAYREWRKKMNAHTAPLRSAYETSRKEMRMLIRKALAYGGDGFGQYLKKMQLALKNSPGNQYKLIALNEELNKAYLKALKVGNKEEAANIKKKLQSIKTQTYSFARKHRKSFGKITTLTGEIGKGYTTEAEKALNNSKLTRFEAAHHRTFGKNSFKSLRPTSKEFIKKVIQIGVSR